MLNFLKAKKPELTVTLDRPNGIYYPGETVGVTVEVQPGKDLKVQGAHVTLSGIEEYKYRTRRHSTDSDGNTSDDYSTPGSTASSLRARKISWARRRCPPARLSAILSR